MSRIAVFWDRDDTLTKDPGYLSDPDQLELLPGAGKALADLAEAGFLNVLITNQSGVARGYFTEERLEEIHARLQEMLTKENAQLDAIYACPFLEGEAAKIEAYRQDSDLRKPKPGMLAKASLEHHINLAGSWCVGDSLRDTQAGRAAGCRTILLASHKDAFDQDQRDKSIDFVATSLEEAVEVIMSRSSIGKESKMSNPDKPAMKDDDVNLTLQEILQFMRMVDRRSEREDFSLAQLAGAIVQILAIGALIWSIFGWIQATPGGDEQLLVGVRLGFGVLLQLLALTLFIMSGRK